jgi:hypothetical protein
MLQRGVCSIDTKDCIVKKRSKADKALKDYKKEPPVISITKATMDRFKDEENSGDLLALYGWYCFTAAWQESTTVWANVPYMVQLTKWSPAKVRKIRRQLIEMGLIKDVQIRKKGGNFGKRYVAVHYFTVLRKTRSTVDSHAKCLTSNREVLNKHNYREAAVRPRKTDKASLVGRDNSFCTRYGQKMQVKLELRSKYKPVAAATWAKEIHFILFDMRVPKDHFKKVMKWYFSKGRNGQFCPKIFKVKHLVEKFRAIEDAMRREQGDETYPLTYVDDPDPRKSGYYDEGKR